MLAKHIDASLASIILFAAFKLFRALLIIEIYVYMPCKGKHYQSINQRILIIFCTFVLLNILMWQMSLSLTVHHKIVCLVYTDNQN